MLVSVFVLSLNLDELLSSCLCELLQILVNKSVETDLRTDVISYHLFIISLCYFYCPLGQLLLLLKLLQLPSRAFRL